MTFTPAHSFALGDCPDFIKKGITGVTIDFIRKQITICLKLPNSFNDMNTFLDFQSWQDFTIHALTPRRTISKFHFLTYNKKIISHSLSFTTRDAEDDNPPAAIQTMIIEYSDILLIGGK